MLRSFCRPVAIRSACSARGIATAQFVTTVEKVQEQLQGTPDRRTELLRHGRHLFDSEVLDDLSSTYTPAVAGKICHCASQLRVSPVKSQPYHSVVEASLSDSAIASMDAASLARIVHSCLVLRSPLLYDILISYIQPIINGMALTMNASTTAVLINAYGRAGVRHAKLYEVLCDMGATALQDPRLSLAHVANVAHAVSRVHYHHPALLDTLRQQALRGAADAPAIVAVTLLDAFAEMGCVDEELFGAYEKCLQEKMSELQGPLLASWIACAAKAGRSTPELMASLGAAVERLSDTLDSASVAKLCDAFFQANVLSEEVLGALAERACKVTAELRGDEVALVLNALSAFDLFDAELFPLLASRIMTISKQGEYLGPEDAATVLASFAAVQERHEELIHFCTQVLGAHAGSAMSAAAHVNALWACGTLQIHNDAQMQLVDRVKKNPELLQLPTDAAADSPRPSARMDGILQERRRAALQMFKLPDINS